MAGTAGFGAYLAAAIFSPWNFLFLAAGTTFVAGVASGAFLSGYPGTALLLLGAVEVGLVTIAAASPRFQRAVDARMAQSEEERARQALTLRFNKLFYGLDPQAQERFQKLKARCESLRDVHTGADERDGEGLEKIAEAQRQNVDRLLWVYLKLLHTQATLDGILKAAESGEIERLEAETQRRLRELSADDPEGLNAKKRRSLEDTLQSAAARRGNLKKARDNSEFVALELERIGSKLAALAEMAANRHDAAGMTREVDEAASSVESTEQAMSDLQSFTGFTEDDLRAPRILSAPPRRARA